MRDRVLEIEGLELAYRPGELLLEVDRLEAGKGEIISIIGRNGSGKSTLLKTMAGFQKAFAGTISIQGGRLEDQDVRSRAKMISFVSANAPYLPSLTVWDLVALGRIPHTSWSGRLSRKDREFCRQIIAEVGLKQLSGRPVHSLSDGERQRAMIARAFVQDTPIVLLDEPTAFLDIPNTFELTRILKNFRDRGRTLITTTHDFALAIEQSDQLWVLKDRKLYAGSPGELVRDAVFDDLFLSSGLHFDHTSLRFRFGSADDAPQDINTL